MKWLRARIDRVLRTRGRAASRSASAVCLLLAACGDEARDPAAAAGGDAGVDGCAPGERTAAAGGCVAAGMQDNGCGAGELFVAGTGCRPAGIPAEACADGFVPDGEDGCSAVLPAAPCARGLMAVPGETRCRPVAPCGEGTWGDIPIEADTQHVDGSHVGGASDGSADQPWTTIHDAIAAAAPGAIVAVAAGTYAEAVEIDDKPVRLWGRCPEMVEIVGPATALGTITVLTGTDDSQIRDVAVTGETIGIAVSGAEGVLVDRVWVHDTAELGVDIEGVLGPTRVALTRSLIEAATMSGAYLEGAEVSLEASVVRDGRPTAAGAFGVGITVTTDPDTGARADVDVRGSVVEQNHEIGVLVMGSDLDIQASVVRGTKPRAASGELGRAFSIQFDHPTGQRGKAVIETCVVDDNHDIAVLVGGSDATIESTVVERTKAETVMGHLGRGIVVQPDAGDLSVLPTASIRASVVRHNRDVALAITGGTVDLEATVVRDTLPRESDERLGLGIGVAGGATATLRSCVVARNTTVGLSVSGAHAVLEATAVRDTLPQASDGYFGRGVDIAAKPELAVPASARLVSCVLERNQEAGLMALSSDVSVEGSLVRDTSARAADGAFGDGVVVWSYDGPAGPAC